MCSSVQANTPFQRTEQNRTICQVLFGSYELNILMFGPNRTEHLQYGYQIKWSWAATCEKLVDSVLTRLFIALDMHVNHSMNVSISQSTNLSIEN